MSVVPSKFGVRRFGQQADYQLRHRRLQQRRLGCFLGCGLVGATVIATTRTNAKRTTLLVAGAHHVIATEEDDLVEAVGRITQGKGARVVFDPVGGLTLDAITRSMASGGVLFIYGALSTKPVAFRQFTIQGNSLTIKDYL